MGSDATVVAALEADKANWQFTNPVEGLKGVLPDKLLIQGRSPLELLNKALSHDLHNESDGVCLQAAQDVRTILTALAKNLHEVVTEDKELHAAVAR